MGLTSQKILVKIHPKNTGQLHQNFFQINYLIMFLDLILFVAFND